jgi:endo-1,4-beta-xylanase
MGGSAADGRGRAGRWRRTGALVAAAAALVGAAALPGTAGAAEGATGVGAGAVGAGGTLAGAAARWGRDFGVSVQVPRLEDAAYRRIVDREFNSISPENVLEWDALEPARGQFTFTLADRAVGYAEERGMRVRGRGLVSPNANHVLWVANLGPAELAAALTNHIDTVLTHLRGRVHTWHVVSEAFLDSGLVRPSFFQRALGTGYIERSFVAARAADPGARLCYNDFTIEDLAGPKTQAVLAMVRDFRARGVPIDCVGLESHFVGGFRVPESLRATIEAFAALGVDVELSELDIAGSGAAQADQYSRAVGACLAVARCTGITVWGVRDSDSWRPGETPVLFDTAGRRKPAYHATLATLCRGPRGVA